MNSFNDNNFKLRFDGEQHQLDANVLISSLIHTTAIIQETNKFLDSGKKIEIKVKALEKGSFLIHIELIETTFDSLKTIFTRENIETGGIIISAFVGFIEIKKFLKGIISASKVAIYGEDVFDKALFKLPDLACLLLSIPI